MKPTVLIADDEEAPRAQLLAALHRVWPEADLVAECVNGVDAWDAFLEHDPAVCFLDIRMPGLSGIEVAQRIDARAQVVFVTAHGDHALAAFDAGALDYVMKPVDDNRLAQAEPNQSSKSLPSSAGSARVEVLSAIHSLNRTSMGAAVGLFVALGVTMENVRRALAVPSGKEP